MKTTYTIGVAALVMTLSGCVDLFDEPEPKKIPPNVISFGAVVTENSDLGQGTGFEISFAHPFFIAIFTDYDGVDDCFLQFTYGRTNFEEDAANYLTAELTIIERPKEQWSPFLHLGAGLHITDRGDWGPGVQLGVGYRYSPPNKKGTGFQIGGLVYPWLDIDSSAIYIETEGRLAADLTWWF